MERSIIFASACIISGFFLHGCYSIDLEERLGARPEPEQKSADSTNPANIEDLKAAAISSSVIRLSWTAPGDDGLKGRATAYYIGFIKSSDIEELSFEKFTGGEEDVTIIENPFLPSEGATPETYLVEELEADTSYCFAIRSVDDAENYSNLSNVVCTSTVDANAPAAATNLALAPDPEGENIALTWVNPEDADLAGILLLRRDGEDIEITKPEDGRAYSENDNVSGAKVIAVLGKDAQEYTDENLINGNFYTYGVFSFDDDNLFGAGAVESAKADDQTAPSPVTDTTATDSGNKTIRLKWKYPSDKDALTALVIRKDATEAEAPVVSSKENMPEGWGKAYLGTDDEFTDDIPDELLDVNLTYAIYAIDDRDNISAGVIVPAIAATPAGLEDTTSPAQISDLEANALNESEIMFTWTTPGDDGMTGQAARYEIRFAEGSFEASEFDQQTLATDEIQPGQPNTPASYTLSILDADTVYCLGIKTFDESDNPSPVSITCEKTLDLTPPAPIADLTPVIDPLGSHISFTWQNPTDEDFKGVLIARSAGAAIDTEPISGEIPVSLGNGIVISISDVESLDQTKLDNGVDYYYNFYAYDDDYNYSEVSSVSVTPVDSTPPSPATNFAMTDAKDGKLSLSWHLPSETGVRVKIVCKASVNPSTITDGTVVYEGIGTSTNYTGLTNGTEYHCGAWTYDEYNNYGEPIFAAATPRSSDVTAPDFISCTASATMLGESDSVTFVLVANDDLDEIIEPKLGTIDLTGKCS
ncbi:MAG: hypothetical protein PHQ00_06050, partial [Phycisphaerae bacterium]|nr:hypothetical protein [Phycisphaerae bacterium]